MGFLVLILLRKSIKAIVGMNFKVQIWFGESVVLFILAKNILKRESFVPE